MSQVLKSKAGFMLLRHISSRVLLNTIITFLILFATYRLVDIRFEHMTQRALASHGKDVAVYENMKTQDTRWAVKWTHLINTVPRVHVGASLNDTWCADQAALYQHLRKVLAHKQLATEQKIVTSDLFSRRILDLQRIERTAYPYIQVPEGEVAFDVVRGIHEAGSNKRGLVTVVSSGQYRFMLHLLTGLRYEIKSTIPVEIWYNGESDLTKEERDSLESVAPDIVARDLQKVNIWNETEAGHEGAKYALKPFAMLASSFSEPIVCDADVIFLSDPIELYDYPGYKQTGTLFFHDRIMYGGEFLPFFETQRRGQPISPQLSRSRWYHDEGDQEQDSGVVVIDKSRQDVLLSFLYTTWLNSKPIRDIIDGDMFGDKETYWMGFELTQQPYYFLPSYGGPIGPISETDDKKPRIECDHIFHYDEELKPLWYNGGLMEAKHMDDSPWQKVDGYGLDDGGWGWGLPKSTYVGGTVIRSETVQAQVARMVKLAKEMEEKYAGVLGSRRGKVDD